MSNKYKRVEVNIVLQLRMTKGDNFLDYELAEVLKGNTDVEVRSMQVKVKRNKKD